LIGVVVPTLGQRADLLIESLKSIRSAGRSYVLLVAPRDYLSQYKSSIPSLFDSIIEDPGEGLAAAINIGIRSLPKDIEFTTWLGDDDLLKGSSLVELEKHIRFNSRISAAFGRCEFINASGKIFGKSRLGPLAVALLKFGPDFIPQPSSLFRRSHFDLVGGLDTSLKYAFDLDLFLKLADVGKIIYVNQFLAQYRWHPDSLSSANKADSRDEARLVRYRALPNFLKPMSGLWEIPMEFVASRFSTLDHGARDSDHFRSNSS
jgi:hypothetical protein